MLNKFKFFLQSKSSKERISRVFERTAVWLLRGATVLFPIFILPWPAFPLESAKAVFAITGSLIILIVFLIGTAFASKRILRAHGILYCLVGFLALAAISALFSLSRKTGFTGIGGREMWSVAAIFALALTALMVSNLAKDKKDFAYLLYSISLGIAIAGVLELMQLGGKFPYPFAFARQRIWSSLGTPKIFAFVSASGIAMAFIFLRLQFKRLNFLVVSSVIFILIDLWVLLRVDFYGAWLFLALGALMFVVSALGIKEKILFLDRYLPVALFLAALILAMTGSPIRQNLIPEFNLSDADSVNITKQVWKNNPLLGSGPGTFEFSYSLYRPVSSNSGELWNARFDRPSKHILTILSDFGVFGLLAFVSPVILLAIALWKKVAFGKLGDPLPFWAGGLAFIFFASYFFFASNFVLSWYGAVALGMCVAILGRDIVLRADTKRRRLIGMIFFAIILVSAVMVGVIVTRIFLSEARLAKGLDAELSAQDRLANLDLARRLRLDEPRILRAASKAALQLANEISKTQNVDAVRVQKLLEDATLAVKQATIAEPQDVENWLALGAVYQNLLPFVEGSAEWVVRAYSEALAREPSNPLPRVEMGKSYLTLGDRMKKSGADESITMRLYQSAEEELIKALSLKADYAPIHFYLALAYERQGRENDALLKLEAVEKYNPSDVGVAYELGMLYLKRGDLEKAKLEFTRAVSNLPSYSDARFRLADVMLRLGESNRAIEELRKILQYNPDDDRIRRIIEEVKAGRINL